MIKEAFINILARDLNKLKDEINLYKNESDLWKIKNEIKNSSGNLCLHLLGNLNHFIGAVIGNSGYVRNRDYEFTANNIARQDLIKQIEETSVVVKNALEKLSEEDFKKDFPVKFNNETLTTNLMLLNIVTHFNYHLGQINYHRRLI
jgi:hypothetical protein